MIPPELLNNMAVLMLEQNRTSEAENILAEAIKNCEILLRENTDDRVKAISLTVRFNQAWCLEQNRQIAQATEIYKAII
jgi:hypothetical protein